MQARLLGDLDRALVERIGVEAETGHEEDRGRQQQDEEPVRERAGEQAASDRGVPLDDVEAEVDRGVVGTRRFEAGSENPRSLRPARETADDRRLDLDLERPSLLRIGQVRIAHPARPERLISAGSRVGAPSPVSSLRTRASKYTYAVVSATNGIVSA